MRQDRTWGVSLTQSLMLLGSFVVSLILVSVCFAQDASPNLVNWDEERAEQAITPVIAEAKDTVSSLLTGDFSTVTPLISAYLFPALISLALIMFGYTTAKAVGRMVGAVVAAKVDPTFGQFLGKLITNVILIMLFLGILGYFGVDVTAFAAVLAASGFAVGMALQGALSNFAAGVMLLVFRPFKVGDLIRVSDCQGVVGEIDLFATRLNTLDNRHLILPNGEVFGSVIENVTHNKVRRVDVSVGVSYDADLRQTRQVLESAVTVVPGAVTEPATQVALIDLGDSAVNWEVRVWSRPDNFLEVRERVTAAVKEALDAANIAIPYPQLDIHVTHPVAALRAA